MPYRSDFEKSRATFPETTADNSRSSIFSAGSLTSIGSGHSSQVAETLSIRGKYRRDVITGYEIVDVHGSQCKADDGYVAQPYKGRDMLMCFARELPADAQLRLTVGETQVGETKVTVTKGDKNGKSG